MIIGGNGNDHFQIGQLFLSPRDAAAGVAAGDIFATTLTTRGYLSNGVSYATAIDGGTGSDVFTVFHNLAPLALSGGSGNDTFTVRAFAAAGSAAGAPGIAAVATGVRYIQNGLVTVDGGANSDQLSIIGTEFNDSFAITAGTVVGAGLNVAYSTIEKLNIDMAEGNDTALIRGTAAGVATQVFGGIGNDTFIVGNGNGTAKSFTGTQTLPAGFGGLTSLGGLLTLTADGGAGSIPGIGAPVMLPGEHDTLKAQGKVLGFSSSNGAVTMTIDASSLNLVANGTNGPQSLVGKTLDIATGAGAGKFWIIDSVKTGSKGTLVLTMHSPTQAVSGGGTPTNASTYAITAHSSTFFAPTPGKDSLTIGGPASTPAAATFAALNANGSGALTLPPDIIAAVGQISTGSQDRDHDSDPGQGTLLGTGSGIDAGLNYALNQFSGDPNAPITDDMLLKMAFQALQFQTGQAQGGDNDDHHHHHGDDRDSHGRDDGKINWKAAFDSDWNKGFSPFGDRS